MTPTKSVEEISKAIESYQLLSSKDLATMRSRWFQPERKEVSDPEKFRKWLVANRYLTDFAAKVVSGKKSDQLVLNQYRLVDQMISGPMAGAYLAIDSLDRHVSIEVLSSKSAADKAQLAGFQEAAHKAMSVHHANVGRIVDVGEAHGLNYLVEEFHEGPTLEDVLERRGKLPYQQAARLMALALAGVEALHSQGVPAGDLAADCLLLAPVGKNAPNQRTIKILHAGVRRRLFDQTAIGRSISIHQGIPDELELATSCTFEVVAAGAPNPPEDIFRLGCLFYRCVTGQAPYSEHELRSLSHPAQPTCKVSPEIPEMLGQIIDEMIDPVPSKRPKKAEYVAKSLRVFLSTEEHTHAAPAEENIASPTARLAAKEDEEETVDDEQEMDEEDEEEAAPHHHRRKQLLGEQEGLWNKAVALWMEVQPEVRDLVFLAGGALLMLALIFLGHLITGLHIAYIAGLFTGAVISYFAEMILRWRQKKNAEVS